MTRKISLTKRLLVEGINENRRELWDWQFELEKKYAPPFYCSVDLRDSGHKIVPVDSNLFPAGFNNICPEDNRSAPATIRAQIDQLAMRRSLAPIQRILIIPESHTSNGYYIENLYYLRQIVENAGYEVKIAWYGEMPAGSSNRVELISASQKRLEAHPLLINSGQASIEGFKPDLLILNNDFSSGYPRELDAITQPIVPSHRLGWHSRKKSTHFKHYNELANEFARIVGIDPWLIQVDTEEVAGVNFNEDTGIEEVAQSVDRILTRTRDAYAKHSVKQEPFVFVKNNAGTYGMGIMVVHSADELRKMNRRAKNKMSVGKNRSQIESLAIQEGIPTATLVDRLAAEPVIYLVGYDLIGGFLRTNSERGTEDNLNSPGMVFKKLCMSDLRKPCPAFLDEQDHDEALKEEPVLELVYGSIARLSAFATGMELAENSAVRIP